MRNAFNNGESGVGSLKFPSMQKLLGSVGEASVAEQTFGDDGNLVAPVASTDTLPSPSKGKRDVETGGGDGSDNKGQQELSVEERRRSGAGILVQRPDHVFD